jgi:hypothetical protein
MPFDESSVQCLPLLRLFSHLGKKERVWCWRVFSFLESHIYTRMYQAYRIGWMELTLV